MVETVLLPSNLIGILLLLGLLALVLQWRRTAIAMFALGTILLAVAGWSPLGPTLLAALEDRFPQPDLSALPAGILMLGGAVNVHISDGRGQPTFNDAAERVTATAMLARRFPQARILLSGGAHDHDNPAVTESSIARDALVAMGVDPRRIELEDRSRTTYENAVLSKDIARPRVGERWLLVTSASHMPRAVGCFRAAAFPIVPYPVDYRTRDGREWLRPVESIASGLDDLDLAAHEWLGLAVYRLLGRTQQLFPSPAAKTGA
ncbi:MAG: YdcF family protein [Proteobacteria bacterium]|nr:YdcF family protein [Pseudomonadota bacterium]